MRIIQFVKHTFAFGMVVAAFPIAAAGSPVVIAHRGGAALRPENTIAAFQHALKLGVQVIEFDMNVTADRVVVIHHDSTVNAHVCRPPAGSPLKPGPIALLTLAEIKQFDCGSFARPNSPHYQSANGERMPTLDEFLSSVKGSGALLLAETKMPPAGAEKNVSPDEFIDLVHAAIKRHGVEDRFILQSADYRTIDAMWKKNPEIRLCLLNARRFKPAYLDVARRHHATHLMLKWDDIDAAGVQKLKQAGLTLFSSTANTDANWQKYVEMNLDGILTDDPRGLSIFLKQAAPTQ
jgi:glycerophosphoryl diester phosphodiesterase